MRVAGRLGNMDESEQLRRIRSQVGNTAWSMVVIGAVFLLIYFGDKEAWASYGYMAGVYLMICAGVIIQAIRQR
jgi:hypothetical protein